jgi:hypothetical protein
VTSLFDNLTLKIVALILGLLLWFHVATEKTYVYQVRLPISVINLDDDLSLVRFPVDSVTVVVSASGKQLLRSKWREDGLRINAVAFAAGRHQMNLTPANISLVTGANLISLDEVISPSVLELYIDRTSEVMLPVEADLVTAADDGFAVASISPPQPAQVKVVGPRSVLGGFKTVFTEHKEMTGLRNSLELALPLASPPGHGIELEPDSVILKVQVVPIRTRVFDSIPVVLYNVPVDQPMVARPQHVTVVLTGPPDDIDSLDPSAVVASADYVQKNNANRAALKVGCPATFKVKSVSADSVAIRHP